MVSCEILPISRPHQPPSCTRPLKLFGHRISAVATPVDPYLYVWMVPQLLHFVSTAPVNSTTVSSIRLQFTQCTFTTTPLLSTTLRRGVSLPRR